MTFDDLLTTDYVDFELIPEDMQLDTLPSTNASAFPSTIVKYKLPSININDALNPFDDNFTLPSYIGKQNNISGENNLVEKELL